MANGKTQKVRGILMRVFLNWLIFKQITSTKNKVAYLLLFTGSGDLGTQLELRRESHVIMKTI